MNVLKKTMKIGVSVVFIAGFAACNNPGPTEATGQKIDNAAPAIEKMGQQGENTADVAIDALPTPEEFVKDIDITAQVNAAIHADPALSSFQISVTAIKGVITLSGSITSQDDIDKAVDVASAVNGVKDVKSEIVLK